METRTKVLLALLIVALLAVGGGIWQRMRPVPQATAQTTYRIITSGAADAAPEHAAMLKAAAAVPGELDEAQAQSRKMAAPPSVVIGAPETAPKVEEALTPVPPSQQILIGFSGGVIGETDPCG